MIWQGALIQQGLGRLSLGQDREAALTGHNVLATCIGLKLEGLGPRPG